MLKIFPKISILIPTLNASSVLENCLASISEQDYPRASVEIIVADGGSSDRTLEIAKKYKTKVIENSLKTGEAGKMAALKISTGEFVALIDSDNILPSKGWIRQMIEPLVSHPGAVGSEPIEYTWRRSDGFITRYCALVGMNDPFVMFLGNYDRLNIITGKWTEVPHEETVFPKYLLVKFIGKRIPTIGANGTVFRADFLKKNSSGDYLFDIDILANEIKTSGSVSFIKVKNGIIHSYCEASIRKFIKKQQRRASDYLFHKDVKGDRSFDWQEKDVFGADPWGLLKFVLFCLTVLPLLYQAIKGFSKKPDPAWFFHPLACEITFFVYAWYRTFGGLSKKEFSRKS